LEIPIEKTSNFNYLKKPLDIFQRSLTVLFSNSNKNNLWLEGGAPIFNQKRFTLDLLYILSTGLSPYFVFNSRKLNKKIIKDKPETKVARCYNQHLY